MAMLIAILRSAVEHAIGWCLFMGVTPTVVTLCLLHERRMGWRDILRLPRILSDTERTVVASVSTLAAFFAAAVAVMGTFDDIRSSAGVDTAWWLAPFELLAQAASVGVGVVTWTRILVATGFATPEEAEQLIARVRPGRPG
jgi:hypothetical protein